MECLKVSLLFSVCLQVALGLTLDQLEEIGKQYPGSSNITLLNVGIIRELPTECQGERPCFPKCCPFGEGMVDLHCAPTSYPFDPPIDLFKDPTEPFYIMIGKICMNMYLTYPDEVVLFHNGTLVLKELNADELWVLKDDEKNRLFPNQYCLDIWTDEATKEVLTVAFVCEEEDETRKVAFSLHDIFYPIGILVSVCFLLITMFIYLAIPDLRDLQGMSLACHLLCQAVDFIFLAAVQFSTGTLNEKACHVVAYTIQFMCLGSFFWLNVMSFDATWCVIVATLPERNPEEPKWWWKLYYPGCKKWVKFNNIYITGTEEWDERSDLERKQKEKRFMMKVFMVYSAYAWFFSLLPMILIFLQGYGPTIPNTYLRYNLISVNCYSQASLDTNSEPYLFIPVGTVLILNIIMYIFTMVKISKYPWNSKGPHRIPRQKARMCMMLFVLVTLIWLADIFTWALKHENIRWMVMNVYNILQGLITFLIFVLEDRVRLLIRVKLWPRLKELQGKYCTCKAEEHSETVFSPQYSLKLLSYGSLYKNKD
ncbi:G-protein coupled receptor Mth2 isoform X1 [Anabrus simplex]|uniref:G-protein coupled receptor Mth2 isoform X1 n=1 Tax=Anabrus simplex TaxID=316456 RepID=UPI0035A2656E